MNDDETDKEYGGNFQALESVSVLFGGKGSLFRLIAITLKRIPNLRTYFMQAFYTSILALTTLWPMIAYAQAGSSKEHPITGAAAYADWSQQKPGVFRKITAADLPKPHATGSVDNDADVVTRPKDAMPQAPAGFKVEIYAEGLDYPRGLRTAPNGDLFLAESHNGEIKVFRGVNK